MDLNHRPHAYQACALTSWAIGLHKKVHLSSLKIKQLAMRFPSMALLRCNNIHVFSSVSLCLLTLFSYIHCLYVDYATFVAP